MFCVNMSAISPNSLTEDGFSNNVIMYFLTQTCMLTSDTWPDIVCVNASDTTSELPEDNCTVHMRMLYSIHHVIFSSVEVLPVAVKVHPAKNNQDLANSQNDL